MDPILGQITETAFNWEMQDWALCDGRIMQINQNQALYSLLGNRFGGDGVHTFAIPDYRPRDANGHPLPWDPNKTVKQISLAGYYPNRP